MREPDCCDGAVSWRSPFCYLKAYPARRGRANSYLRRRDRYAGQTLHRHTQVAPGTRENFQRTLGAYEPLDEIIGKSMGRPRDGAPPPHLRERSGSVRQRNACPFYALRRRMRSRAYEPVSDPRTGLSAK
jgi:hypothetical protein